MYPNKDIKVGLLSNGTEDTKGNLLTKEVFQLLKESDVNFIGNIEGTDVLTGKCDIVVCDGFIGNIVLKNIEGSLKMVIKQLVKKAKTTNDEMEKKYLLKTVNELLSKYDLNSLSGATLLGVDKVIMKGHGNANENTIYNIVKQVYNLINNNLITNLKNEFNNK
jgi:glycerol-3-phosphate acyltransferase PlsX